MSSALAAQTQCTRASELLEQGKLKYSSGDRMGALKLFERVLQTEDASRQDQQAALYNSTCVHASFGDLELAQMTLREGLAAGLDYEAALQDPSMVKMDSSAQVRIQLKRFSEAAKRIRETVGSESGLPAAPAMAKKAKKGQLSDADLSDLLDTELKPGLDTSLLGIVKRVVLLLLVAVIGGTVLFYAGLKFAFPDYKSITRILPEGVKGSKVVLGVATGLCLAAVLYKARIAMGLASKELPCTMSPAWKVATELRSYDWPREAAPDEPVVLNPFRKNW
eukprot:jgi/Astpho2/3737/fgenesh1_pg.00060_%23_45_t